MTSGGAAPRRKGHNFERQLVREVREVMPGAEVRRGLQSRGGGAEVPDVECPIFHVEAKVGKLPNPRAALAQAIRDAEGSGKVPLAVIKDDRQQPFAVLRWSDMREIMGKLWDEGWV